MMHVALRSALFTLVLVLSAAGLAAQETNPDEAPVIFQNPPLAAPADPDDPADPTLPDYVLGPGDEITIMALDADEISGQPIRIGTEGDINLPMVGRIEAAGMTLPELEAEIVERLKVYIRQPDLAVSVSDFQSQPVSVLGAVGSPGIVQLEGRRTLMEVLSLAGGLRPDHGARITITRKEEMGLIPLPNAKAPEEGQQGVSLAEVSVESLMDGSRSEQNIRVLPHDVISVSTAEVVYVMGEVQRPGGFTLNDKETLSVLQALALAEGLLQDARAGDARIIRPVPNSSALEIPVNLTELLRGQIADVPLEPDDVLFVPSSLARSALRRTLDAAISAVTGIIIYRR